MSILDTVDTVPCHPENRGGKRTAEQIRYLVYHYTGNDGDRGAGNAKYYRNNVVYASAHYFVDDETVTRSVEDLEIAWAVGGKKWADCPKTGGGTLYGTVTNGNSISIELCDTERDGELMATESTLKRGAELGRALMEKYGIPVDRVVRHFDVTGKHCPAYFMDGEKWAAFKERLAEVAPSQAKAGQLPLREEPLDQSVFEEKEEIMRLYRYVNQIPVWARAAAEKAIRNGYIKTDGTGAVGVWETNLQTLVWMDRAGLLDAPAREA